MKGGSATKAEAATAAFQERKPGADIPATPRLFATCPPGFTGQFCENGFCPSFALSGSREKGSGRQALQLKEGKR